MGIIYFAIFLGVLIFIHELGHFLVARALGITVVRFSIGFGPRVIGFRRGETDYCISAFPLGGYVKFLGDDPEEEVPERDRRRAFLTTDIWRRVLVVVAGPLFNLLLPFFIFFPLFATETSLLPAVLGDVEPNGPAHKAGLRPGDRVLSIEGKEVKYWWELLDIVSSSPGKPLRFKVQRGSEVLDLSVTPKPVEVATMRELGLVRTVGRIEVVPERSLPVVIATPGGAARKAGIRDFDALLWVDGQKVGTLEDALERLKAAFERPVPLVVAETIEGSEEIGPPRAVVIGPLGPQELGLRDARTVITKVEPSSPAERAGIRPGDRLLTLDGEPVSDFAFFVYALSRDPSRTHTVGIEREGKVETVSLSLLNPKWSPGSALPKYEPLGAFVRRAVVLPELVPNDNPIRYGLKNAFSRTFEALLVTGAGIVGLITGKLSVKELGGPIMIYDIASRSGEQGLSAFFGSMAWLSISLGLLNLLPIPILDGGHLVLFGIEALRRRPLSRRGRQIVFYAGLAFLVTLMVIVFANDIQRKWASISEQYPGD